MRNINISERGRSMIEMLGVLAIIGVLSVGGIAGYSKAMMKYRINKAIEQVSQISQNVRTMFAAQRNYGGLDSPNLNNPNGLSLIKKAKLILEDMIDENNSIVDDDMGWTHQIFNPFGGGVVVWSDNGPHDISDCGSDNACVKYFQIIYFDMPEEACMALATQDWRSSAMGLTVMEVSNTNSTDLPGEAWSACGNDGYINAGFAVACPNGKDVPIPMPPSIAAQACNCSNNDCTIMWGFK